MRLINLLFSDRSTGSRLERLALYQRSILNAPERRKIGVYGIERMVEKTGNEAEPGPAEAGPSGGTSFRSSSLPSP
mgnify:CR=1 FL=1